MKVHTLSGSLPLTKTYSRLEDGQIFKTPYPMLAQFTSHEHDINSLKDLYVVIQAAARNGHCLIKGNLSRELKNESRAGATNALDETEWVCFDLDDSPYTDPNKFMSDIGLRDVSYIVQYSASYGITTKQLGCHIFVLLSEPVKANMLKVWLQSLNLNVPKLKSAINLSKSGAALGWPLDITCCQNDKLIYICEPILRDGITADFTGARTQLIERKLSHMPVTSIGVLNSDAINKEVLNIRDGKRKEQNLEPIRRKVRFENGQGVQAGVTGIMVTGGPYEARGFIYLNLNGGDSWAYYIDPRNPKYIRNFKGEPWLLTEEIMPEFYAELVACNAASITAASSSTPFICSDLYSATYYRGTIDPQSGTADLNSCNRQQCEDWMLEHNLAAPDFIPTWRLRFEPHNTVKMDVNDRFLNLWQRSKFYDMPYSKTVDPKYWPTIYKVFNHLCVHDTVAMEYVMNWLAVAFQHRIKIGTAILAQGAEGTGKGTLINRILKPLAGHTHAVMKRQSELTSQFNEWLETALFAWIDEVEIGSLKEGETIQSDLKNYITEPYIMVNAKHAQPKVVENFTNFFFATNKNQGVIMGATDRRFTILDMQRHKIDLDGHQVDVLIPQELEHFFGYIMTREADIDKARTPLKNQARAAMIELSKTSDQVVADALHEGNLEFFVHQMPDDRVVEGVSQHSIRAGDYKALVESWLQSVADNKPEIKVSRDDLYVVFEYCIGNMPLSTTKFSQRLSHKGLRIKPMFINGKTKQGLVIVFKMSAEEAAEHMKPVEVPRLRAVK